MPQNELHKHISICTSRIQNIEKNNHDKRNLKIKNLKGNNEMEYAQINIINLSEIEIPEHIKKILSQGISAPCGGVPNKNSIHGKFENFFNEWVEYAQSINLDLLKITEIKSLLFLQFLKFSKCASSNSDTKTLRTFLRENENILVCPVDKGKDVVVYNKSEYIEKLNDIFEPGKFVKLKINPIKTDLKNTTN